ncbi:hypothetical protein ACLI4U_13650 [Natrialbaceae archaeon A-CW2]
MNPLEFCLPGLDFSWKSGNVLTGHRKIPSTFVKFDLSAPIPALREFTVDDDVISST